MEMGWKKNLKAKNFHNYRVELHSQYGCLEIQKEQEF